MTVNCPECGSKNTQKSSAFYEQNVRTTEGRSSGIFLTSRGTVGIGKSRNQSRASSLAAEVNAPHHGMKMRSLIASIVGFVAALVSQAAGGGYLLFVGLVLMGFLLSIYLAAPTQQDLAEEQRWRRQWYCRKCGSTFLKGSSQETGTGWQCSHDDFVSPVMRQSSSRSRQEYVERAQKPIQRAKSATKRHLAGLAAIRRSAKPDRSFDPETLNCDLGVISRLSSLSLIEYDESTERFLISDFHSVSPEISDSPHRGWWQRNFGR